MEFNIKEYRRYRLIEKIARGEAKLEAYEALKEGICYELESWQSLYNAFKSEYIVNADMLLRSIGR
jgi:hypothetical protein